MIKPCPQCNASFEVTDSDHAFLQKVSPTFAGQVFQIPEPKICFHCGLQAKLSWRNERSLYHRKCDKTGKEMVSIYSDNVPFPVYYHETWFGDDWDPMDYGHDFDFSKTFAENYKALLDIIPHCSISVLANENSEYTNESAWNKDCYWMFEVTKCQNCMFGSHVARSQDCLECTFVDDSELCYDCVDCHDCYDLRHSQRCTDCSNSFFLLDCRRCRDCFACVNLTGKKYCWFNEQLTKEECKKRIGEFNSGSRSIIKKAQQEFMLFAIKHPRRAVFGEYNEDSNGNGIFHTKNCKQCFDSRESQDSYNLVNIKQATNSHSIDSASEGIELCYCVSEANNIRQTFFSQYILRSENILYSQWILNSKNIFGSYASRRSKNCILNKAYPISEYGQLVAKIIHHMQETGEWGKYFPAKLSPFGYNETVAASFFPLSKSEVIRQGLRWQVPPRPKSENVLSRKELPDDIANVSSKIISKTLRCPESHRLFRIQKNELDFYKKYNIPLPDTHPDVRNQDRWQRRQPYLLWKRKCEKCKSNIQAVYAPNTPEIIYCESCYEKEVE